MSKFFEALEQAERDRALQEQAARRQPVTERLEPPAERSTTGRTSDPVPPQRSVPAAPAAERIEAGAVADPTQGSDPVPPPSIPAAPVPEEIEGGVVAAPTTPSGLTAESAGQVDDHLVSLLTPHAFGAEQYRAIRHVIEEEHQSGALTVVAVASPGLEEGKTTTAINLAGALAQAPGARVLLIEADLRRPSVVRYLGLDVMDGPGLVDLILQPGSSLNSAVRVCAPFNLSVLPAGKAPAATYEVLKSPRLSQVFEEARQRYDYVIVDTPPLCPIPDGRFVVKLVDGVLLVAAAHRTSRRLLDEALEVLPTKPIAIVFNGADSPPEYYHSGYGTESQPNGGARLVRRRRSG